MNKSNLMSKAHAIAKTLIGDYKARLSMALKMVWAEIKKGVNTMVEMVGAEKQVKYAQDIKENMINFFNICKECLVKAEYSEKVILSQTEKINSVIASIENEESAKEIIEKYGYLLNHGEWAKADYLQEEMKELKMLKTVAAVKYCYYGK